MSRRQADQKKARDAERKRDRNERVSEFKENLGIGMFRNSPTTNEQRLKAVDLYDNTIALDTKQEMLKVLDKEKKPYTKEYLLDKDKRDETSATASFDIQQKIKEGKVDKKYDFNPGEVPTNGGGKKKKRKSKKKNSSKSGGRSRSRSRSRSRGKSKGKK